MTLSEALSRIVRLGAAFTTSEAAGVLGTNPRHASVILARLAVHGHVQRLVKGRWMLPGRLVPYAVPEALTRPIPSYVSLQSALYHHGLVEQVPDVVYAVTLGPTRRVRTPVASVSFHRSTPDFFFGFERDSRTGATMALPEKALLDFFYLRPARSRAFRALPELVIPTGFSAKRARDMARSIKSAPRRVLVERLLDETLRRARR